MSAKENQYFTIYAGDVFILRFPLSVSNGSAALLVAPSATFKAAQTGGPLVVSKTSPSGGVRLVQETISGASWWVCYVDFAEADTIALSGKYSFQLRVTDGPHKLVAASGAISIKALI
jgi:hypothetical protein